MEDDVKTVSPEMRTYTQEEVEKIVEQFNLRMSKMQETMMEMKAIIESKRLDYLFDVVKNSLDFDGDIVDKAVKEITESLFSETSESKDNEKDE